MLFHSLKRTNASGCSVIRFDLWLGGHAQYSSRCRTGWMLAALQRDRRDSAHAALHQYQFSPARC
ncbi:Hypothetical protein GbCGDNIH3_5109 [Granulibacter bethesdensis]|uniref:Uncharacterized protein n=1 Tax=Granulibacter bethesdensis TaxID=364410 RepID=A0AAN0RD70_9PROT|nr:Hypothetical protein GbCGDNIH3_5109 [Granulibacter bethesdensis]